MIEQSTWQELTERIALLENESVQRVRLAAINTALFRISDAVSTATSRQELYRTIHLALSPVIDTTNFFIALYEKSDDSLIFSYIVDTVDTCYPPVINVSKTASLTAAVIRSQAPLLIRKDEILERQTTSGLVIPKCTPAEVWLGAPLKTPRGIIGVVAVQSYKDANCYDETDLNVLVSVADMVAIALERKHAEDALRESEEKFRQIITTVREGIVSINADRRITFANPYLAEMLGYKLEELMGQSLAMLLHEEDRPDFSRRQDEREKGKIEQFERRFRTKDGRELWTIGSVK